MEMQTWLSYANLSDHYERKARFLPGLISVLFLLPVSSAFGVPFAGLAETVAVGMGTTAAVAVGLSHLASAAGNRFQERLWPRWPYDSPTNQWLLPDDKSRSEQQKSIWYAAIKRLTGLDIIVNKNLGNDEIERIINDAVSTLRYRLWNSRDQKDCECITPITDLRGTSPVCDLPDERIRAELCRMFSSPSYGQGETRFGAPSLSF